MKQGDKFIVVQKGHVLYGKVVTYHSTENLYLCSYCCFKYKSSLIALSLNSLKPLERFPADDEQPNN
jgi:hypothetical protein